MILRFIKKIAKAILPKVENKKDLHGFEYTVTELVQMYENSQASVKWHGEILTNNFLKYKKSDTLFILGSGPSINEISADEWEHISNYDSIGFNYWFAHDFVPDMYMFQIPTNDTGAERMTNLFQDRYEAYEDKPFIMRGSGFAKGYLQKYKQLQNLLEGVSLYYLNEYPIAGRCSITRDLLYRYMDALGFMTHGKISELVPKWRSSIGLLIMLAYQMGYKKIALCGVDMQDASHFWDYGAYQEEKEKYDLPDVGDANINSFTDKSLSSNTVPEYVYGLRDWFKEKNGVSIYTITQNTVLYPEIELYNIQSR